MVDEKRIILEKYLEKENLIESQIKSFNNFCDYTLTKIMEENQVVNPLISLPSVDEVKIVFKKIFVEKPCIYEVFNDRKKILWPLEARMRKLTYSGIVKAEVVFYLDNTIKEIETVEIAKLPIMVKSKYCNLYGLSEEELMEKGEDPMDCGGYFIINGNERVVIIQEDLAGNRFFIEEKNGKIMGKFIGGKSIFRNILKFLFQFQEKFQKSLQALISLQVFLLFAFLSKTMGMECREDKRFH
ncbi:TPA: hypothetical protein EYP13_03820, partial [Candidatus Micrarchaeota archaeon]|nr:hypothetical protein [Candidatus Micrarchaeota archaeon]